MKGIKLCIRSGSSWRKDQECYSWGKAELQPPDNAQGMVFHSEVYWDGLLIAVFSHVGEFWIYFGSTLWKTNLQMWRYDSTQWLVISFLLRICSCLLLFTLTCCNNSCCHGSDDGVPLMNMYQRPHNLIINDWQRQIKMEIGLKIRWL